MAYALTARVLEDPHLPPGPRLVLAVLAAHANGHTKQCWPGIRRIMARTGMGERTITRAITMLRDRGYILAAKGRSKARTTLYTLRPEKWPEPTTTTGQSGQVKPAKFDGSNPPSGQHNLLGSVEEGNGKEKAKTCDESQEEQDGGITSTTVGKIRKGGQVKKVKQGTDKTDIEIKNVNATVVTSLTSVPPPSVSASKLAKLWIDHASKQGVTACLTSKEGKMLRDAGQKIGYGNVNSIIPLVVAEWKAFTDFCYHEGVAFTRPKNPQVAFFLKFVDKAYGFAKRQQRRLELTQKKEESTTRLFQLLAQRDELRESIAAKATTPLTMAGKKNIMRIDSYYIEKWEKVFGPVTVDFLNPGFEPNSFYEDFCSDPKIELPDPTAYWVQNHRDYIADLRSARISHALWDDAKYQALEEEIDQTQQGIKAIESSILKL